MLPKNLVALALLYHFSISLNASIAPSIPSVRSYKISSKDILAGKYINEYIKSLKNYKLNPANLYTLNKRLRRSATFKELSPIIQKSLMISRIKKSTQRFLKVCLKIKTAKLGIEVFFQQLNNKNCLNKFLEISSHNLKIALDKNKYPKMNQYFKKNLLFFLERSPSQNFIHLLKKSKKNTFYHKKLSSLISQGLIKNNISPYTQILPYLIISHDLAAYIQLYGTKDLSHNRTFSREFTKIKKNFYRSIRAKDPLLAKNLSNQLLNFFKSNSRYLNKEKSMNSFISVAKNLVFIGEYNNAQEIFMFILTESHHKNNSKSLYHILWPSIILGDTSERIRLIQKYNLVDNFNNYDDRLKFWIAYTLRIDGEKKLGKKLYKKLIDQHPLSFYSTVAARDISDQFLEHYYSIPEEKNINPKIFGKIFSKTNIKDQIKRILIWIHLNKKNIAQIEFHDMIKNSRKIFNRQIKDENQLKELNNQFISYTIQILNSHDHFLDSFKIVYNSKAKKLMSVDRATLKLLYPTKYLSLIKSTDRSINSHFVLSLIRQESAFNPRARSHVGARGLMQLMPGTAKMFQRKIKNYQLNRPKTNVKIGMKYLKKLLKEFNNNIIYSLAAYNAGETRVRRWRKNIFINEDPLATIESIPYLETRKYVQYIYRNMFFYSYIRNKKKTLEIKIKDSFHL